MQTHKYTGKLFDVEYSSIRVGELGEYIRSDSEYYDPDFLKSLFLINTKSNRSLNVISNIKGGKRLPKGEVFSDNGINYIRAENVKNSFIDYKDTPKISLSLHKKLINYQVKYDDILITIVGNSIGDIGMIKFNLEKCNLTENCAKITNYEEINPNYLFSFLLSVHGNSFIQREKVGTAQPKLSLERIRSFSIPIPSPDFQEKIQEFVIESYRQKELSEKFYQEAQYLLLSELNLVDYQTKTKTIKLQGGVEMQILENHATINYKTLHELDRFDAEYWDYDFVAIKNRIKNIKSEKLGVLITYKKGIEVGTEAYIEESEVETIEDKKYFVRVSNFSKSGMTFNNAKFIKNNHFETLQDYQPQQGEILFSKDGTAGIAYLLRENIDGIISGGILRFQNTSNIPSEYLELVLNSIVIQKEVERQTNGALIQHLKITDALDFNIPLIGDDKIKIITEKIQQSFIAKQQSQHLLELAKTAVEIYIEQDEGTALAYIDIKTKTQKTPTN